jgi:uncharacterized membrane protein YfcA
MDTLWVIITLVFIIAFIFSMFGQGGGSVYTPVLFLFGYAVLLSVSTSLVLNLITSMSAGYVFYRHGMIDVKRALLFVPGIIIGSLTGSVVDNLHVVSTTFLLWLFVAFLVGAGARMVYSFREKGKAEGECPTTFSKRMYALIIIVSFLVGMLSSMLGVGGGIIIVPFMTYICKYPTRWAAGASHLIISFSALFGVIGHSAFGNIDLPLVLSTGAAVLVGGNLGGRIGVRMKSGMMKVGVGIIMWVLAAQVVLKLLGYL